MKHIATLLFLITTLQVFSQKSDTAFFPKFAPYSQSPIINYGDGLAGSPWGDPVVLKENNQYIMYASGCKGGITHPNDTLGIYRFLSNDGYSWTLNPIIPVLKPLAGTYYDGGIETPSVVFYKGQYHMYNTVYKHNVATEFMISHATSPDGIHWQMDANPMLKHTAGPGWMSEIIGEPGAMIKSDTLYLFFTAYGGTGYFNIGLARSADGSTFFDTIMAVTMPTDVYPKSENYVGLSTPSALMVGDTIYLFTDVAQMVLGNWTQVAFHQFKSFGDIHKWHYSKKPVQTMKDLPWTNGNYFSQIVGVTPLLDGNKLRLWYSGHHLADIDTSTHDTSYNVHFTGNEMHADSGYWGIGTSETILHNSGIVENKVPTSDKISIHFEGTKGAVKVETTSEATLEIYSISGQLLIQNKFHTQSNFSLNYDGLIVIRVLTNEKVATMKAFSYQMN